MKNAFATNLVKDALRRSARPSRLWLACLVSLSLLVVALVPTAQAANLPNDYFVDRNQDGEYDGMQGVGAWGQDFPNTFYLRTIRAHAAWDTAKGNGIVIGTLDTGLDLTHPDIRDNLYTNPGETGGGKETNGIDDDNNNCIDDVHGCDFTTRVGGKGTGDPTDLNGHGTAVAGIAAAEQDNGEGISGVAPQAKVLPTRITTGTGSSNIDLIGGVQAAGYLTANPSVNVIIVSGGLLSTNDPTEPLPHQSLAIGQALCGVLDNAVKAGKIVVVAAGNGATNGPTARNIGTFSGGGYSPAFCPRAITATSTEPDRDLARRVVRSEFADFGTNVLLGAPGGEGKITDPGPFGDTGPKAYWNNTILTLRAAGTNGVRRYIGDSGDPGLTPTNDAITDQVSVRQAGDPLNEPARYVRWRGTSFTAPQVAGTVALMLQASPALRALPACTPNCTSPTSFPKLEAVKDILSRGATDRPDSSLGAGLLDTDAAVSLAKRFR